MNGQQIRDVLAEACERADVFYTLKNGPARITIECDEGSSVRLAFEDDGSLEGAYVMSDEIPEKETND